MANYQLPHHKDKPYGGAGPVNDVEILKYITKNYEYNLQDENIHQFFVDLYRTWILTGRLNTWQGLDGFSHAVATQGTTEVFDKFYIKHNQRRFRCFRGEYMYHQLTWRRAWPDRWAYIEDAELNADDAVVISYPFADTGNRHPLQNPVLAECSRLGIPVLLDCAYFGICAGLDFDVTWPCITDLAFSLSKTFPVPHARIGMRLTREDDDDAGFVLQKSGYVNRMACGLGSLLLQNFTPDQVHQKYHSVQKQFCEQLDVAPSACVIFGIGDERWQQYNRGTATNRLSFHKYLYQGTLPNESGNNI